MLSVSGFQWGEDLGGRFFGCAGPAPRTPTSSHRLHAVCGPQQLALVPSAASIQHIQFPLAGRHLSVSQVTTGDPLHRPLSVLTSSHTLLTPDTNVQLHMSCWPKTFHPQHGGPGGGDEKRAGISPPGQKFVSNPLAKDQIREAKWLILKSRVAIEL